MSTTRRPTSVPSWTAGWSTATWFDVLFVSDDGSLVVVDYKTDVSPTRETLEAYRVQLAVYARVLAEAAGRSVSRGVLVFCREGEDEEVELPLAASGSQEAT